MPQVFRGVGVSPGVAVGRVYVLHPQWMPVVAESIPPERVADDHGTLVFVEVKTRAGTGCGTPAAAVDRRKQRP